MKFIDWAKGTGYNHDEIATFIDTELSDLNLDFKGQDKKLVDLIPNAEKANNSVRDYLNKKLER